PWRGAPDGASDSSPRCRASSPPGRGSHAAIRGRRSTPGASARWNLLQGHVGILPQLVERLQLVRLLVEDAFDARVDENLEAVDARRVRDVDVAVADAGAVLRCLRDGVDLGVDAPEAVLLDLAARRGGAVDETSRIEAVREPCRRSVVAGGEVVLVAHV